jgi:hypothetical protein
LVEVVRALEDDDQTAVEPTQVHEVEPGTVALDDSDLVGS